MFDNYDFFEYSSPDDALEQYIAPMDVMYKIAIGEETFESTLTKTSHVYHSNTTGEVVAHYNLENSDFVVYPFDPTDITIDDLKDMLKHYEEIEDYEKCAKLLKIINGKG